MTYDFQFTCEIKLPSAAESAGGQCGHQDAIEIKCRQSCIARTHVTSYQGQGEPCQEKVRGFQMPSIKRAHHMTPTLITITTGENFPNEQYTIEQSTNNCNPENTSWLQGCTALELVRNPLEHFTINLFQPYVIVKTETIRPTVPRKLKVSPFNNNFMCLQLAKEGTRRLGRQ